MPLFIEFYNKNKYILGGKKSFFHLRGERCEFRPSYWLFLLTMLLMLFSSSRQCCKRTTQPTTASFHVFIVIFDIINQPTIRRCGNINVLFKTSLKKPNLTITNQNMYTGKVQVYCRNPYQMSSGFGSVAVGVLSVNSEDGRYLSSNSNTRNSYVGAR
jgi:hypothetical protein